jgi:hypothetical protein
LFDVSDITLFHHTVNLKNSVKELNSLHTKRLMVNFDSDEVMQEREIDGKTQEITGLFHHAESLLNKFGKQGDEKTISVAERTVRGNMQRSIAKKLQGLSMSFRSSQKVPDLTNAHILFLTFGLHFYVSISVNIIFFKCNLKGLSEPPSSSEDWWWYSSL